MSFPSLLDRKTRSPGGTPPQEPHSSVQAFAVGQPDMDSNTTHVTETQINPDIDLDFDYGSMSPDSQHIVSATNTSSQKAPKPRHITPSPVLFQRPLSAGQFNPTESKFAFAKATRPVVDYLGPRRTLGQTRTDSLQVTPPVTHNEKSVSPARGISPPDAYLLLKENEQPLNLTIEKSDLIEEPSVDLGNAELISSSEEVAQTQLESEQIKSRKAIRNAHGQAVASVQQRISPQDSTTSHEQVGTTSNTSSIEQTPELPRHPIKEKRDILKPFPVITTTSPRNLRALEASSQSGNNARYPGCSGPAESGQRSRGKTSVAPIIIHDDANVAVPQARCEKSQPQNPLQGQRPSGSSNHIPNGPQHEKSKIQKPNQKTKPQSIPRRPQTNDHRPTHRPLRSSELSSDELLHLAVVKNRDEHHEAELESARMRVQLEYQVKNKDEQNRALENTITDLRTKLQTMGTGLHNSIQGLAKDHNRLRDNANELAREQHAVQIERQKLTALMKEAKSTTEAWAARVKEWKDPAKPWAEVRCEITRLEDTVHVLQGQLEEKSGLLADERDRTLRLERDLTRNGDRHGEIHELLTGLCTILQSKEPNGNEAQQVKLEQCLEMVGEIRNTEAVTPEDVQSIKDMINSLSQSFAARINETEYTQSTLSDFNKGLDSRLKEAIVALRSEIQSQDTLTEQISELSLLNRTLTQQVEISEGATTQAREQLYASRLAQDSLQQKIYSLESEATVLRSTFSDNAEIVSQLHKLESQNTTLLHNVEEVKEVASSKESQLDLQVEELELLRKGNNEMHAELDRAQGLIISMTQTQSDLQESTEKQMHDLRTQLLLAAESDRKEQALNFEDKLSEAVKLKEAAGAKEELLQEELKEARVDIAQLKIDVEDLEGDLTDSIAEVASLRSQVGSLTEASKAKDIALQECEEEEARLKTTENAYWIAHSEGRKDKKKIEELERCVSEADIIQSELGKLLNIEASTPLSLEKSVQKLVTENSRLRLKTQTYLGRDSDKAESNALPSMPQIKTPVPEPKAPRNLRKARRDKSYLTPAPTSLNMQVIEGSILRRSDKKERVTEESRTSAKILESGRVVETRNKQTRSRSSEFKSDSSYVPETQIHTAPFADFRQGLPAELPSSPFPEPVDLLGTLPGLGSGAQSPHVNLSKSARDVVLGLLSQKSPSSAVTGSPEETAKKANTKEPAGASNKRKINDTDRSAIAFNIPSKRPKQTTFAENTYEIPDSQSQRSDKNRSNVSSSQHLTHPSRIRSSRKGNKAIEPKAVRRSTRRKGTNTDHFMDRFSQEL
ncbi:MAG: hypothetical protein M1827_007585 [Pycnora praestabilis]|nr:MAG: hypothetical protein M1827_007585 [Pycnora praestabilis]